jgi:hypothetical protein
MARTFRVKLTKSIEETIEKAKKKAAEKGAEFIGDQKAGSYRGKNAEGTYEIDDDQVILTVTKKPPLVPWTFVETKIKKFFS